MSKILQALVRLRRSKKLRQVDLAKKMKISRQQVFNLENSDNPSLRSLEAYAKALGASLVVVEKDH